MQNKEKGVLNQGFYFQVVKLGDAGD